MNSLFQAHAEVSLPKPPPPDPGKLEALLKTPRNRSRALAFLKSLEALERTDRNAGFLYCVGDSHVKVFDYIQQNQSPFLTTLLCCRMNAATAAGLGNAHSLTQSYFYFTNYLQRMNPDNCMLLCFGEVDCNSRIPFRMIKHGHSMHEEVAESVRKYRAFIRKLQAAGFDNLIIYNVQPPCQTLSKPPEARQLFFDLPARTEITKAFNALLRNYCRSDSCRFLDIESQLLDDATGLIKQEYINDDYDFHLREQTLAPHIVSALETLGVN